VNKKKKSKDKIYKKPKLVKHGKISDVIMTGTSPPPPPTPG